MISRRRLLASTGAIVATGAVVSACGGSDTPAAPGASAGNPATDANPAGIINLEQVAAFEYLDPQQIYVNNSGTFARLIYRTLMGWKENPADGSYELAPDLSDGPPQNGDGGKTWTFKIKQGIKYSDGSPVTAQDIKYGVERSMDPAISNGPQYAKEYLVGADKFTGPKAGQLASIETPDANTIVFRLKQPVAFWDQLTTQYTFVPVPKAKDTGAAYDLKPETMGPYKFQQYSKETRIVLVKDTNWSKETDPLRSQNFQQVVCSMGLTESRLDNDLISDTNGGTNVMFSDDPTPANINKVSQEPLKSRTLNATTVFIQYIALQQNQAAMKRPEVRQAILLALNPQATIQAIGGPLLREPIQSFAPPTLKGFEDVKDTYELGDTGNPEEAKKRLQAAGVTNLTLTYAFSNTETGQKSAVTVVSALQRAGITVVSKPIESSSFYKTVGTLSQKFDMVLVGWGYDIPDGSTIYPPLFQGTKIFDGSSNYCRLNDPKVNDLIDQALAKPTTAESLPLWQQVDKYIVEQAFAIPRFVIKTAPILGSKVKGVYMSPIYGNPTVQDGYISKT